MKRRSRLFHIAVLACALWQAGFAAPQNQSGAPHPTAQEGAKMNAKSQAATEQPFFCNLSAMDADQRKHHRELTERLRCPFFAFQLEVGSDHQPLWLRITGREGVKPFMQSEFGIK